jgi:hypothetical protein
VLPDFVIFLDGACLDSGSEPGRSTAIALARERGRVVLVGEGNGLRVRR